MAKPILNIDDLSPEERLSLLEQLWESLRKTPDSIPLTQDQRVELDRRLDDLEADAGDGIPWEEVLERIRGRIA
jgi:putative addiction module component (TIGR02574 family)